MKRILITGANSYIGTSFERYVAKWPEKYQVDTIDMHGDAWNSLSFAGYDSVFHVAGIAHADVGKVSEAQKALYYQVNTELAVKAAQKAKADGAKQFIYMSSAIVYGDSAPIGKQKIITRDTKPAPANFYGDSKQKAEEEILPLQGNNFNVVVLRPPMIYGRGSKGNYPILVKYAQRLPVFPDVKNQRSMLYIENFCEFVRLMMDHNEKGIFWPQNKEYASTSQIVKLVSEQHGKHILLIGGVGWLLKLMSRATDMVNKAFGSFCYEQEMSEYSQEYRLFSLKESIRQSEIKGENHS